MGGDVVSARKLHNVAGTNQREKAPLFNIGLAHLLIAFFVVFFVSLSFPYSGDDWAWGSSIGIERLSSGFANYNGRYLGNLLVLVLTRSYLLRSLVIASIIVLLSVVGSRFAAKSPRVGFWIIFGSIAAVSADIRAQGIVWVSGFTNYAVPGAMLVVYAALCRDLLIGNVSRRDVSSFAIFLLALSTSLFMENITIYCVVVPLVIIVYSRVWFRFWNRIQFAYAFGSIVGALIMFSNGAYWSIALGADTYRSVASSGLLETAFLINDYILVDFLPPLFLIGVVDVYLAVKGRSETERSKTFRYSSVVYIAFLILTIVIVSFDLGGRSGANRYALLICSIALYGSLLIQSSLWWLKEEDARPTFMLLSMLALVLPLFVVRPFGPRNFLPVYFFLVLYFVYIISRATQLGVPPIIFPRVVCTIAILIWAHVLVLFAPIQVAALTRVSYVKEQVAEGAEEVTIQRLPDSGLVWTGEPDREPWITRYKLFYNIPEDVVIHLE